MEPVEPRMANFFTFFIFADLAIGESAISKDASKLPKDRIAVIGVLHGEFALSVDGIEVHENFRFLVARVDKYLHRIPVARWFGTEAAVLKSRLMFAKCCVGERKIGLPLHPLRYRLCIKHLLQISEHGAG